MSTHPTSSYFVTGFPGFIGKRLVRALAAQPGARLHLLVQAQQLKAAQAELERLGRPSNVHFYQGDVSAMHLGLSGSEYRTLSGDVTHIIHLAAVLHAQLPRKVVRDVNVEGTANVLEFAAACSSLVRLVYFSTCFVSGDRVGVIAEDELDCGQRFRNVYEETKFEAEQRVRAAQSKLPITILRPATVVGDSTTGEIDRFDGPYYLGMLLVLSPLVLPLPLPGDGVAPLNVVPVDFVVAATLALMRHPRAGGRTFHLVDPNPMSARRAYEIIAEGSHRRLPRLTLSTRLVDRLMRLPGLETLLRPQRAALHAVNHLALYTCHNTLEFLEGSGVRCPPLQSYLGTLVAYTRQHYLKKRNTDAEDELLEPVL